MQDSIYVKGKACPDRFKKIMFEKGSKELKEKEKDKMFSLLEIDLVAFLLYEFI